jgi:membrane-associated protease RseP (regulator of RpoE activity)
LTKEQKTRLIQLGLFIVTLITTTLAGTEWTIGKFVILGITWEEFLYGFNFSIPFLGILTVHEFGHYFAAQHHRIKVSLPYYIPLWLGFIGGPSIGTMGAFIRIREHIGSKLKYFDVGIAGPLAGFIVAVFVLWYGFQTLPETDYIFEIHPEYEIFGENFEEKLVGLDTVVLKSSLNPERDGYDVLPDTIRINDPNRLSIQFGDNILMNVGRRYFAPSDRYVPSSSELMHYPWLLAGFLALFFTALNLLPIGQLDGGHVIFGLFGPKYHPTISRVIFTIFVFYTGLGWVSSEDLVNTSMEGIGQFVFTLAFYLLLLYISAYSVFKSPRDRLMYATVILAVQYFVASIFQLEGYNGWMLFSVLIGRFLGVDHPPVYDNRDIGTTRKIIGWIALIVFIISFSPEPLIVTGG